MNNTVQSTLFIPYSLCVAIVVCVNRLAFAVEGACVCVLPHPLAVAGVAACLCKGISVSQWGLCMCPRTPPCRCRSGSMPQQRHQREPQSLSLTGTWVIASAGLARADGHMYICTYIWDYYFVQFLTFVLTWLNPHASPAPDLCILELGLSCFIVHRLEWLCKYF